MTNFATEPTALLVAEDELVVERLGITD